MRWTCWLTSALAREATLLLYDGSPFAPTPAALWNFAQDMRMNLFGTSAKYIDGCAKAGLAPAKTHDLSALKLITSTGSPWWVVHLYMGNPVNWFRIFYEEMYEKNKANLGRLIFSTNDSFDVLEKKYGPRVRDRMAEANILNVTGESMRRK